MININTGTEELLRHIEDRVCVITLNKPDKRNVLGYIPITALRGTLILVEEDDRIGCVMITSAGTTFFSGNDVSGMGAAQSDAKGAELRIFNKVFPDQTFREDSLEFARSIANGQTMALERMKLNLNRGVTQSRKDSLALEAENLMPSFGNSESKEAISAFMEKRTPIFHK